MATAASLVTICFALSHLKAQTCGSHVYWEFICGLIHHFRPASNSRRLPSCCKQLNCISSFPRPYIHQNPGNANPFTRSLLHLLHLPATLYSTSGSNAVTGLSHCGSFYFVIAIAGSHHPPASIPNYHMCLCNYQSDGLLNGAISGDYRRITICNQGYTGTELRP